MKILFIISTLRQGRGGHYHSLNHISREIGSKIEVKIITLGTKSSEIVESNPYFIKNIFFNGLNIWNIRNELNKILNEYDPNILHCFDVFAFNISRLIIRGDRYKYVLNKCGGPNPYTFPRVENLVVFSKENEEWFKKNLKFNSSLIYLIPNRVRRLNLENQDEKKPTDTFNFVRITRIGNVYKKSILDSIHLIRILKQKKIKCRLYVIGSIQDENVFKELTFFSKDDEVVFLTNKRHAVEASKMLYLADAAIATGRGVMEASSLGLPVLTPASNSSLPILITEENFNNFFATNFSERSVADKMDLKRNIELIIKLIKEEDYKNKIGEFSLSVFISYFDISNSYGRYLDVYQNALKNKFYVSRFSDIIAKLKTIRKFFIYSK